MEISKVLFELFMRRASTFQKLAAEFGHSPFQLRTLLRMDPERPIMMSEVAELAMCDPGNLTGVVDKLEARRLVERKPSSGDRRVKMLSMTPEGQAQREQMITRLMQPASWMVALPKKDQKTLLTLLRKGLALAEDSEAKTSCP
jgi:DNA-binding MarR family transcriptional regulator